MRTAEIKRTTNETNIRLSLALEGTEREIHSGSGFFDHMLTLFACHGNFGLTLVCDGDLGVDFHHSCEDIGIVLGEGFKTALGDKRGIVRYGHIILPMDEALVLFAADLSGRSTLVYDLPLPATRLEDGTELAPSVGVFDCELVEEFFQAFCRALGANIHIKKMDGRNTHHIIEGVFKAFGRVMKQAVRVDGTDVPSSKGVL